MTPQLCCSHSKSKRKIFTDEQREVEVLGEKTPGDGT